jgi:hypothetical protein
MKDKKELQKRARSLVSTSVDDLQSSLPYLKFDSEFDIAVVRCALSICEGRGEKTKAKLLKSKLNKMKKEFDKQNIFKFHLNTEFEVIYDEQK